MANIHDNLHLDRTAADTGRRQARDLHDRHGNAIPRDVIAAAGSGSVTTASRFALAAKLDRCDPLTPDEYVEAAACVRRAPQPTQSDYRRSRDNNIREYVRRYCWDAPSERGRILKFLLDLRTYRAGEFRHHQHCAAMPADIDERRGLLWTILIAPLKAPDTIEGVRLIVRD